MIILKVKNNLTTDECIQLAKKAEEAFGELVIILDNKVKEIGFDKASERDITFYEFEDETISLPYTTTNIYNTDEVLCCNDTKKSSD